MKKILNFFLLAFILFIVACDKTVDPPQPEIEPEKGTLFMHLHNYVDINEVDAYGITYTMSNGRKISLDVAQFYISNILLIKSDGSVYTIPDTIIVKTQDIATYTIAKVPVGNYKSIHFDVGLSAAANQKIPSSSSSDVLNKPEMWFGASAQPEGYVFLNLQGKVDTTAAANGSLAQMKPFVYKIGTTANSKHVVMPDNNYTVVANQAVYIHLLCDVSKLFNGIQLNDNNNLSITTTSDNATILASQIKNNIPSMFAYE